jgi:hypothetical protein
LEKYGQKLIDILIIEGKKTLGEQVKGGKVNFSNFIFAENFRCWFSSISFAEPYWYAYANNIYVFAFV